MYEWAKGSVYNMTVTLYPNSITLNSSAAASFSEVRWVMLGLDRENYKLAIKPVYKKELDIKAIPTDRLHKISVGKGYARICNKSILNEIAVLLDDKLDSLKVTAQYDEADDMLVVKLNEKA